MPRIELSAAKGLVQLAGQGFIDKDAGLSIDADLDLTTATATAAEKGALIHSFVVSANRTLTLHSTATTGQIKIILNAQGSGGNVVISGTNIVGNNITLGPADFAICVFNGTEWEVSPSLA
jgi:hypothetical protein